MPPPDDPIRFTDVLTMATSIASYLGVRTVEARHVLDALAVLRGERTLSDLGRPLSPLVARPRGGPSVDPRLQRLVQQWWTDLGSMPAAEIAPPQLESFAAAVRELDTPRAHAPAPQPGGKG